VATSVAIPCLQTSTTIVRRAELLRRIAKRARSQRVRFELVREGGSHSLYRCGAVRVTVPRHTEINELTARGILAETESVLGEGWWR
jgi:mRNA interferase HicA